MSRRSGGHWFGMDFFNELVPLGLELYDSSGVHVGNWQPGSPAALPGLSNEMKQKLQTHRPRTIGHASRIDGVTPAALTLLVAHVRRGKRIPAKTA